MASPIEMISDHLAPYCSGVRRKEKKGMSGPVRRQVREYLRVQSVLPELGCWSESLFKG